MQAIRIVGMCIASAVFYGILHDQVTAHVCVEYFTIGHPPTFNTENPMLLGLGWGVIATWWVGLFLGIPLAFAAQSGARPPRSVSEVFPSVVCLLVITAASAFIAGLVGWWLAGAGVVRLVGPLADEVPADRHISFLADLWAHSASYLVGCVGGIVVIVRVWRSRR